jgi:TPR repeat protein
MEPEKRRFVRKRTDQLLYAEFGPDNGSILLNLCEEGCSFQSIAPVRDEQLRISFSVGDGKKLEGDGQMVWSDTSKTTGGLRFLNPSARLRKQVREWLEETVVTADGKLDRDAVCSKAKRRRKKLREEARAAAEMAWKEGALKAEKNTWTAPTESQTPMMQTAETASAHWLSFNPTDESAKLGYGNATRRGVAAILLISALLVALITYRRELGHLVMSFGSSIAGEEQRSPVAPATEAQPGSSPASSSPVVETKPAALQVQNDAKDTSPETLPPEEQVTPVAQQTTAVQTSAVKRAPSQQASAVEDVPSLWASVENGDTHAEVTLANRYTRGEGVPQSCAQARVLLEAAAKRGNLEAKQKLDELPQAGCP